MAGGGDEGLDVTAELGDDQLRALFDALDAGEYAAVGEALDAVEARVAERGGEGNAATLRTYWLTGAGGRAIRWGTDGDFTRCVRYVGKYMSGENTRGYCARLHKTATGYWPGKKLGSKGKGGKGGAAEEPAKKKGRIRTLVQKALRKVGIRAGEADVEALAEAAEAMGGDEEHAAEAVVGDYIREHAVSGVAAAEASIAGTRSFSDVEALVRAALQRRRQAETGRAWAYVQVSDLTAGQVVYAGMGAEEWPAGPQRLYQCSYTVGTAGDVTLGEPSEVVRTYAPAPAGQAPESAPAGGRVTEAQPVTEVGHVIEARGQAGDGGRVYRIRVINEGDSANGRRYRREVLEAAVPLYEGARVFDGHRSDAEMRSSATAGLVGHIENAAYGTGGIDADLHLFPSATRQAEALDASVAAQAAGRPALAGISHDALARFSPLHEGGRQLHDTTAITAVNSADIVAVPAAGGRATRVLAGGEPEGTEEPGVDLDDLIRAAESAPPETRAKLAAALGPTPAPPAAGPPAPAQPAREAGTPKGDFVAGLMVTHKLSAAGLPEKAAEAVLARLPDRVTEADIDREISLIKEVLAQVEPIPGGRGPTAQVTLEAREKKARALDLFWDTSPDRPAGAYTSFREAYCDITGVYPRAFDGDFARRILRESFGGAGGLDGYDSARSRESLDSTTWAQVLGDSITRQMIAMYKLPSLSNWRDIVSSITSPTDFRTNRRPRWGGYGTLPVVNEGQPYQPLTSPPDEEATYGVAKRGGTEDVTWEMIKNDDVGQIQTIPMKLGRAAAQTLYRFVWDLLRTNATCTYDSTALFHTNHANTATSAALSGSTLSTGRQAMQDQTAYGDSSEFIDPTPKFLVHPNELEELAFQLCTSAVALPSGAPTGAASNIPNIHSANGLTPVRIPYWTDANDWMLVADPALIPTIEIGFLDGRQDPELFTQADPTQGSVFNADKYTYKIRHVYSGTILDHRGFYRGQG